MPPINPTSARATARIMINRSIFEENRKMETSSLNELTDIFRFQGEFPNRPQEDLPMYSPPRKRAPSAVRQGDLYL
jgi:hypothetical protein